jgi:tetratricopeptide (TPR) repeat protein
MGDVLSDVGRIEEALDEYRAALATAQKLADDHPSLTEFRPGLARTLQELGLTLFRAGRFAETIPM